MPDPVVPPVSVQDLLLLIGEQQVRIVQLARALEQAQQGKVPPPPVEAPSL